MKQKTELLRKSVGAALLIALGDCVLLKLGQPIGPFLFALGLIGVCYLGQNLFTGKCGFLIADHIPIVDLLLNRLKHSDNIFRIQRPCGQLNLIAIFLDDKTALMIVVVVTHLLKRMAYNRHIQLKSFRKLPYRDRFPCNKKNGFNPSLNMDIILIPQRQPPPFRVFF